MDAKQEMECLLLTMEARNKATRRMLDETERMNRMTTKVLVLAGAMAAGALAALVAVAIVKAVGL
jgi:hypothetical protein